MAKKDKYKVLRIIASVLANLLGILAANYITFYILDHYNPGMHLLRTRRSRSRSICMLSSPRSP